MHQADDSLGSKEEAPGWLHRHAQDTAHVPVQPVLLGWGTAHGGGRELSRPGVGENTAWGVVGGGHRVQGSQLRSKPHGCLMMS